MAIAHTGKPDGLRKGVAPGFTLRLPEPVSGLFQAGSNGQETNQVESGTLRPSLGLKRIISSCLYRRLLENQVLAAAAESQLHRPVHCNRKPPLWGLLRCVKVPLEEGGARARFTGSFAKIRGRNIKYLLRSSKRHVLVFRPVYYEASIA